jgi:hypothetical protein
LQKLRSQQKLELMQQQQGQQAAAAVGTPNATRTIELRNLELLQVAVPTFV